jgi:hypothetical protein
MYFAFFSQRFVFAAKLQLKTEELKAASGHQSELQ